LPVIIIIHLKNTMVKITRKLLNCCKAKNVMKCFQVSPTSVPPIPLFTNMYDTDVIITIKIDTNIDKVFKLLCSYDYEEFSQ